MHVLWDKIKELSGSRLFFMVYLFLFGVAILCCASADVFFPGKVVDATSYTIRRISEYPWIRKCLIAIAMVHFGGGVAFFCKLCYEKINEK